MMCGMRSHITTRSRGGAVDNTHYQCWTSCSAQLNTHHQSTMQTAVLTRQAITKCYQEYIRDKSVQPRIRTVNHILQKWRSKTSHVGMVTIILFLRNAWIQFLTDRRCMVTDWDTYGDACDPVAYVSLMYSWCYTTHCKHMGWPWMCV